MIPAPLHVRAWSASRRLGPLVGVLLLVGAFVHMALPGGVGLGVDLGVGTPPLVFTVVAIVGAGTALAGSVALVPFAPEWERQSRRARWAHAGRWFVVVAGGASIGPALETWSLQSAVPFPAAQIANQFTLAGLSGVGVGLLGKVFGPSVMVVLLPVLVIGEQVTGARWPIGDMWHRPNWVLSAGCLLLGVAAQWWTKGLPLRLRDRDD